MIGKRSADAEPAPEANPEAKPQWWGYPYYGYGYSLIGKRSADAEPAPAAKPQYWGYPYYGYGYYWG